jgi:hypothetical protein
MSNKNLLASIEKARTSVNENPLENKKVWSIMVRLDLTDARQKLIAENFMKIKEATKGSDTFVATELIESGIDALNNEINKK